jgi:hypothetical protein
VIQLQHITEAQRAQIAQELQHANEQLERKRVGHPT